MQPDVDQMPTSSATSSPTRRLTAQEAAVALGITVEAIRGRIKRGTLRSTKAEDGTILVYLDDHDQTNGQPRQAANQTQPFGDQTQPDHDRPEPDADQSPQVPDQSELIRVLHDQLESEREANRENRRIIAILASRVPELEAAPEPPEGPQRPSEHQGSDAAHQEDEHPEKPSWWRRFFGFEA
jgi:hypothetical protein